RMKLKLAMEYTDLAQYYAEQMDTTEGAGLGIALVVLLLRGMNLDPSLFRIGSKHGVTIARIEVPLVDGYVSSRQRVE
ncbi:MAG: histidine kinase, partial [Brevinematales bacterium]